MKAGLQSLLLLFLSLTTTFAKLNLKADGNGIVKLNDASFRELTKTPREHYAIVLMTALGSQFNCAFCKEFDPEYTILSQSWQKSSTRHAGPELYFGHLDFLAGQETFRALQLVSAPNLWIFPPTVDAAGEAMSGEPIRYDFTNSPSADAAAHFISKSIGREFAIKRPFDYIKFARFIATIAAALVTLAGVYRVAGFIFLNKNFWAILSLLLILVFNAGHMYTQIRGSPYSRGGYIAGGFQDQFGAETQIVAATYALLAFSVVILAVSVPRMKNAQTQTLLIGIWLVVQLFVFSFLMQLFRQKNGGYPFKLLL